VFLQAQEQSNETQPREIDLDPGLLLAQVDSWIDGATRALPAIAVALVLIAVSWLVGSLIKSLVKGRYSKHDRHDLGRMLGGIAKWSIIVAGTMVAMTIVMPSLSIGGLFAGLGVSSVAIGFAFKDILQNWLAGLLILLRQPFEVGDQVVIEDYEGTVERIETRSTIVRTYDGMNAVIPNSEIYTNALLVKTANKARRSEYDIGIGYGDDMDKAVSKLQSMLEQVDGVEQDPAPQVLPWDLAASWVTLRMRWWTDNENTNIVAVRSRVIAGIKKTLDEAGIDMPYDTVVNLFHDQTDEFDGMRDKQREGWPARNEDDFAEPRWKIEAETTNETVAENASSNGKDQQSAPH
jgi:small-conductance mechanosensitive channel